MYTLIRDFNSADFLVDTQTKRVVAIANKMHNFVTRACSIEELNKHFISGAGVTQKYFGNLSEAFLEGEILVAKCLYTGRTVKITVKDNLFPLINSAVIDTWKLAQRINDFNTVNQKARDEATIRKNNMYVTYAGRGDASRPNIVMLNIVKHVDPDDQSFSDLFMNLQEDNHPLHFQNMYDLLEGLAAYTWPWEIKFDRTPEMDEAVIAFFNKEHEASIVVAALEFIEKCAESNKRPITSGDAEYIQRN